jgi:microcystin-dependent protein
MSQPFIGEIRMFAGSFAPAGWAFCAGQLMAISENDALFTLIGTTYGGDGQETFGIPDLQGRIPLHMGTNPATGTTYVIGQKSGTESVTITREQLPTHAHGFIASTGPATGNTPANNVVAESTTINVYIEDTPTGALNPAALAPAGGSQAHENMQPFLVVSFIISLFGIFPSQT